MRLPADAKLARRRRFLVTGGLALLLLVALGAAATLRLAATAKDLRAARDLLVTASEQVERGELGAAQTRLAEAEQLLLAANNRLHTSPELDIVGALPIVSDNLQALQETVEVALQLVAGGGSVLDVAQPLQDDQGRLEVPLQEGALPLETIRQAAREVNALAVSLPVPAERSGDRYVVESIREVRTRVFEEADARREQLANVAQALDLIGEMAGANGPRRYLIAVANTAEMRGTGGMILTYGVLESADGEFDLPNFGTIDELFLPRPVDPAAVDVPVDEFARWLGLDQTRLWRNVNLVPDFAVVAPRMEAMYEAVAREPVDGVIQIDAAGLAAILEGIGPITVEGVGEVNAGNVVALTLNEAYTLFPDRDQRQEVLGDVAEVTFERLVEGEYASLRPLGEAVADAAAERHIMFRSSRAQAATASAFFGADGSLPPPDDLDHAMLTVQNFGRNKLDYYLDTAVRIAGQRPPGTSARLGITVTVTNTAPADVDEPAYVFGDPRASGSGVPPGSYAGVVSIYLPTGTVLHGSSGQTVVAPALGTEGGRTFVGWEIELAPGASSVVDLDVTFPPRPRTGAAFELVPMPRVRPTVWELAIDTGEGPIVRSGPLERPEVVTVVRAA